MSIRNFEEVNRALLPYVPLVSQLKGQAAVSQRVQPLMELLGNPQDHLRVVHIAGTSGKTSTAYYIAALLGAGGKKVGLTVSPHIDTISERVQIGGLPLSEAKFCNELEVFLQLVEQAEQLPTYFELLYVFALWVFVRQNVDYAVVETGMGGLYDATNSIERPDKVCVITDIGFDHTHILGNTLGEIAAQKIGIVHDYNHVIMYEQSTEIMDVVRRWIASHHASLELAAVGDGPFTNSMPSYQQRNWRLAYQTYIHLEKSGSVRHLTNQVLRQTQAIKVPARMDTRHIDGKTLIMDGAHNAQKMAALVASFRQLYPDEKPDVLIGLKAGKDHQELVSVLAPLADRVITTTFKTSKDLPAHSMDPKLLAQSFRSAGVAEALSIGDQDQALRALLTGPQQTVIITGSFYLLSQLRQRKIAT